MDFNAIKKAAEGYRKEMTRFLRDMVQIPGESADEKGKIERAAEEMRKLGFNKVEIDPMGNLLGYMGTGKTLVAFDGHID
ncbi:MAG: YgeY family selenium metabolism-linked hydrolase, partial [Oscillospiraceae bacterium]